MPFKPRRHQLSESLLYHLFNRAHMRMEIFTSLSDFEYFFSLLQRYSIKFDVKIFHWVIMNNHFHLLAKISDPDAMSPFMSGLQRAYVSYYKHKYKSHGSIWQGRYKSQPIEKEEYYFACSRYIERNPVEAKIIERAWDYAHSSAGYYVNNDESKLISLDPIFAETYSNQSYADYLLESDEEEVKLFSSLEKPAGSKKFLSKLYKDGERYYPRRQGRAKNI